MFLIKIERSAIARSMHGISLKSALWKHERCYEGAHTNRDGVSIGVGRLEFNHVNCSHFDGRVQDWLMKLLKDVLGVVVVEDQKSFVEVSWFFSGCG